jgi:MraZ protein
MFIGKYYHHLEEKGRLSLPKKFRDQESNWVITRGLDGCLFLLRAENFEKEIQKISNSSFTKKANRDLVRLMTNEAQELTTDQNGRVNLPNYLIDFAELNKELVVVGSLDHIEIWNQEKYHHYIDQIEAKAEEIAENVEN